MVYCSTKGESYRFCWLKILITIKSCESSQTSPLFHSHSLPFPSTPHCLLDNHSALADGSSTRSHTFCFTPNDLQHDEFPGRRLVCQSHDGSLVVTDQNFEDVDSSVDGRYGRSVWHPPHSDRVVQWSRHDELVVVRDGTAPDLRQNNTKKINILLIAGCVVVAIGRCWVEVNLITSQ